VIVVPRPPGSTLRSPGPAVMWPGDVGGDV